MSIYGSKKLWKNKAIILLGARQTGKTTLLEEIAKKEGNALWLNADDPEVQSLFENPSVASLQLIIGSYK